MDLSGANTEAILRFHRFHERFNRSIKVQAIGLGLLADEVDAGTPAETIRDRLYARPDWLWGGMPDWTNPRVEIDAALRDIGQAGVVRAFSAFDLFLDELMAELTSWRDFSGATPLDAADMPSNDDEPGDTDRVERIYTRLRASRARGFRTSGRCMSISGARGTASRTAKASRREAWSRPMPRPSWRRRSTDGSREPVT
ncbi:hypothetical protein [Sphingomonas melonis]